MTTTSRPATATGTPAHGLHTDLGLAAVRVVFGLLIAAHGAQKLFGAFGGAGLEATAAGFAQLGYPAADTFALVAGVAELGGGVLLALGLAVPLASAALVGTSVNILAVSAQGGGGAFFAQDGGYEFQLLLLAVAVGLAVAGPGRLAADHGRPWARRPMLTGGGAVVLGVVSGLAVWALTL